MAQLSVWFLGLRPKPPHSPLPILEAIARPGFIRTLQLPTDESSVDRFALYVKALRFPTDIAGQKFMVEHHYAALAFCMVLHSPSPSTKEMKATSLGTLIALDESLHV